MAEGYNFFEGSQTDINRRLLRKIEALEAKVKVLTDALGEYESEETIATRLDNLENLNTQQETEP